MGRPSSATPAIPPGERSASHIPAAPGCGSATTSKAPSAARAVTTGGSAGAKRAGAAHREVGRGQQAQATDPAAIRLQYGAGPGVRRQGAGLPGPVGAGLDHT